MKRHLMTAILLALLSSATLADSNLSVSFTGNYIGNSQCTKTTYIGHYNPPPAPFTVVVRNTNAQYPIAIKALTFNTHQAAEGVTGLSDISVDAVSAPAQRSLLESCNGKQLAPAGQAGDSCTIPLLYHFPDINTPALTNHLFTVTAISTVRVPGLRATSATLNLNMGGENTGSDFAVTLHNVDSTQTGYVSSLPPDAPLNMGNLDVLYYKGSPGVPATFIYDVKNVSDKPKTVGTRCSYSVAGSPPVPKTTTNLSQCDAVTLAPGKSCQSAITIMPYDAVTRGETTASALSLMLEVFDNTSPIAAPSDRSLPQVLFMGSAKS